jgi:hypothetical protein
MSSFSSSFHFHVTAASSRTYLLYRFQLLSFERNLCGIQRESEERYCAIFIGIIAVEEGMFSQRNDTCADDQIMPVEDKVFVDLVEFTPHRDSDLVVQQATPLDTQQPTAQECHVRDTAAHSLYLSHTHTLLLSPPLSLLSPAHLLFLSLSQHMVPLTVDGVCHAGRREKKRQTRRESEKGNPHYLRDQGSFCIRTSFDIHVLKHLRIICMTSSTHGKRPSCGLGVSSLKRNLKQPLVRGMLLLFWTFKNNLSQQSAATQKYSYFTEGQRRNCALFQVSIIYTFPDKQYFT